MCRCQSPCCCAHYTFRRRYGVFHFLWDCFMTILTFGLWLIWIYVREHRN